MNLGRAILMGSIAASALPMAWAQGGLTLPKTVEAGAAFSIPTSGSGTSTLFIVGPTQVLKRQVQLGEAISIPAGSLYNAGRYIAFLAASSASENSVFDVVPAAPADLTFLAKPSRLPVSLHNGITGAVYVLDAYHNLVVKPLPIQFELTPVNGATQNRTVSTQLGAAWTAMDSTAHEGKDKFVARLGSLDSTRVIGQVPGDPCGLKMSAKQAGPDLELTTDPVKDCSGNPVPDGTIITFTESYRGGQSTVDVPLKRDIADVKMPVHADSHITVASGVVMGNQIGWGK